MSQAVSVASPSGTAWAGVPWGPSGSQNREAGTGLSLDASVFSKTQQCPGPVAQLLTVCPVHQKAVGVSPSQSGNAPGLLLPSPVGARMGGDGSPFLSHIGVSLSLSKSLKNVSWGEDK